MKIELEGFAGEVPKTEPRYLPQTHAQAVSGARLNRGNLAPMRSAVTVETLGAAASKIYLNGSTWLSWSMDVDAAPGPVAQDRLYLTNGTLPQMLYSGLYYDLALPAPNESPGVSNLGTPSTETAETVLYAYTYVTSLGEESPPSRLSAGILCSPGNTIRVSMVASAWAGRLITKKRLYRSVTSSSGATALYFVKELAVGVTSFDHSLTADPAQEPIPSTDYDTPPTNLRGLTSMPNGMMAAFVGKEIYFSEPYVPHAWPQKYTLIVEDTIVGLAAFGTSLAILTTGTPYVAQGLHPESMALNRMEQPFPCLSKRGIVDLGYAAVYPSTNGLVQVSESGAQLISTRLWDREQWMALTPSTFRAAQFMGRYAFSYQPGGTGTRKLAFIDLSGELPFLLPVANAAYVDLHHNLATGRLIGLAQSGGIDIVSLDDSAGALMSYSWLSKPFSFRFPVGFGAVMVDAIAPVGVAPSFQMTVYRDGAAVATITEPNQLGRLPDGMGQLWQFKIEGNWSVTHVIVATTPDEFWQ